MTLYKIICLLFLLTTTLQSNTRQLPVTYQYPKHNAYSADVSFCIADLKFDGTMLKICEFGEGFESRFKGYDALYGKGAMWATLWEELLRLGMPIWVVETNRYLTDPQEFAYGYFKALGGRRIASYNGIGSVRTNKKKGAAHRQGANGIIIAHTIGKTKRYAQECLAKYSEFLVLNAATNAFIRTKSATNSLFDSPDTVPFRPAAVLLKGSNRSSHALQVLEILKSEYIVIKPTDSSLGQGVLLLPARQLVHVLSSIAMNRAPTDDPAYAYWLRNPMSDMMVEAFAPSKTIVVDGKAYDPTMRVAFMLVNSGGTLQITFLGSYWKLPAKSLDEAGTFTQLHKSCVKPGRVCSAVVDDADYTAVQALLCQLLPVVYEKMLKVCTTT